MRILTEAARTYDFTIQRTAYTSGAKVTLASPNFGSSYSQDSFAIVLSDGYTLPLAVFDKTFTFFLFRDIFDLE